MECLTDDFLRCFTDELCSWIFAIKSKHFRVRDSFEISLISKVLEFASYQTSRSHFALDCSATFENLEHSLFADNNLIPCLGCTTKEAIIELLS